MGEQAQHPPVGDEALHAVTEAMVVLHQRYHGRAPATARTQMLGNDLLACLLGDIYTDVEKTMIELQRKAMVHETRSAGPISSSSSSCSRADPRVPAGRTG